MRERLWCCGQVDYERGIAGVTFRRQKKQMDHEKGKARDEEDEKASEHGMRGEVRLLPLRKRKKKDQMSEGVHAKPDLTHRLDV